MIGKDKMRIPLHLQRDYSKQAKKQRNPETVFSVRSVLPVGLHRKHGGRT